MQTEMSSAQIRNSMRYALVDVLDLRKVSWVCSQVPDWRAYRHICTIDHPLLQMDLNSRHELITKISVGSRTSICFSNRIKNSSRISIGALSFCKISRTFLNKPKFFKKAIKMASKTKNSRQTAIC